MIRSGLRFTAGVAAVVAAAAFGVFSGVSSVWATANPNAYGVLAVLSEPAEKADAIPFDGDHQFGDGMGLVYESSRFLGHTDEGSYWVVLDREGNICLASADAQGLAMVFGCSTVESFMTHGISVGFYSTSAQGENHGQLDAYLVPDSLTYVSDVEGLTQVSNNLVAGHSLEPSAVLEFVTRDNGAAMQLATMGSSSQ